MLDFIIVGFSGFAVGLMTVFLLRDEFDEGSSPDSKDFKIDDPVVYNDHGDDYFTHINGVYSGEEKLCYSLEAVEFVVWSSKLRHPTPEELEKYFRK